MILGLVDDLFFTAKIHAAALQCGAAVAFSSQADDLMGTALSQHPSLILVDLAKDSLAPIQTIQRLKKDERLRHIPVLGFYPHVQTGLKDRALNAGCDKVIPRSTFSQNLAKILMEGI